jgi:hypothetical protein
MLTAMTETDWAIVLRAFEVARSRRGDKGREAVRRRPETTVHSLPSSAPSS